MINEYLEQSVLAFNTYDAAAAVQKILLEQGYCVMMSREEDLWILNWVWTETPADRNDVIFINRGKYECEWWAFLKNHPEIKWEYDEDDERMERKDS